MAAAMTTAVTAITTGAITTNMVAMTGTGPTRATTAIMPIIITATTAVTARSEEHTSELQSLMRISYAVFCLKKKNNVQTIPQYENNTTTHKTRIRIPF